MAHPSNLGLEGECRETLRLGSTQGETYFRRHDDLLRIRRARLDFRLHKVELHI